MLAARESRPRTDTGAAQTAERIRHPPAERSEDPRMTDLGLSPNRALDNVPRLCLLAPIPPGKGASGGVWLQGGIAEDGLGWRQLGPSEAVVLRSEAERWRSEGLMRCPGRGGHVPWSRVLTDDRDRRGCQARPREAGSRPSSPGRTSGRFCASWVRPRDAVSIRGRLPREVRAQALEALGRQPSLEHRSAGPGIKGTAVRGAADLTRGRPACLFSARPRGRGRPRLAPPSFFKRTRRSEGPSPRAFRAAGLLVSALAGAAGC